MPQSSSKPPTSLLKKVLVLVVVCAIAFGAMAWFMQNAVNNSNNQAERNKQIREGK